MIWGCMTNQGTGYICWVKGRMNTDLYITILEDELLQTMEYYKLKPKKIIFQQDGARPQLAGRLRRPFQALPDLDANANAIAIEHIKLENEGWERDTSVVEPAETMLTSVVT